MRPNRMDDPTERERLARLYADGLSRKAIAAELNAHPDTVTTWQQREDVQNLVARLIRERTNRVLRHTDTAIESYLMAKKEIDIDVLLKVRKEFNADGGSDSSNDNAAEAVAELMKELRDDPATAKRLRDKGK